MRKILLALVMCLILVISIIVIAIGINAGIISVWGVKQIRQENFDIDKSNAELKETVEKAYPNAVKGIEKNAKDMQTSKTEYESKVILLSNSEYYMQTEEYEIEFLWTKIGNYAVDNNVEMKIEVTKSNLEGRYDLNFTVDGDYSNITQFIYDIENDSKLGFKIENFKMVSGATQSSSDSEESKDKKYGVKGTFSCKEIKLNINEEEFKKMEENKEKASGEQKANETGENANTNANANTSTNTTDPNAKANSSTNTSTTNQTGNTAPNINVNMTTVPANTIKTDSATTSNNNVEVKNTTKEQSAEDVISGNLQ